MANARYLLSVSIIVQIRTYTFLPMTDPEKNQILHGIVGNVNIEEGAKVFLYITGFAQ